MYYVLAYLVNRFFGRRIIGSAPPYRADSRDSSRRIRATVASMLALFLLLMPFTETRQFIADTSHSVITQFSLLLDPDGDG